MFALKTLTGNIFLKKSLYSYFYIRLFLSVVGKSNSSGAGVYKTLRTSFGTFDSTSVGTILGTMIGTMIGTI